MCWLIWHDIIICVLYRKTDLGKKIIPISSHFSSLNLSLQTSCRNFISGLLKSLWHYERQPTFYTKMCLSTIFRLLLVWHTEKCWVVPHRGSIFIPFKKYLSNMHLGYRMPSLSLLESSKSPWVAMVESEFRWVESTFSLPWHYSNCVPTGDAADADGDGDELCQTVPSTSTRLTLSSSH